VTTSWQTEKPTSIRQVELRDGADFGLAISEIRHARGWTQEEMARKLGIGLTRSYLAALESGRTTRAMEHYFHILRRCGATVIVNFDPTDGGDDG
jgi:transcriptional regulator with XRE-family HTH domain